MGRSILAASLLALGLWLGPDAARAAPPPGATVEIENFRFEPQTLEIPAGASVTWRNADEEIHAVVAADGSFTSPGLDTDGAYTHTFRAAGTYVYRCALHPHMSGTIVVR